MNFKLLDTIMAVNIKGPLIVSQAFYPNVKASKLKKLVERQLEQRHANGREAAARGHDLLSHEQGRAESRDADRRGQR